MTDEFHRTVMAEPLGYLIDASYSYINDGFPRGVCSSDLDSPVDGRFWRKFTTIVEWYPPSSEILTKIEKDIARRAGVRREAALLARVWV